MNYCSSDVLYPTNLNWHRSQWYIDQLNRTGLANDGNSGDTPQSPVRTWSMGIMGRLGQTDPLLMQDTTFTFLSGSPLDGSDPITLRPRVGRQSKLLFLGGVGAAQLVGNGVLAGIVPKNYATGASLAASITVPGAAAGMMIVNTTIGKSSVSWLRTNTGGTNFTLDQPAVGADPSFSAPAFVDTWANGDTYALYLLDGITLAQFEPTMLDFGGINPNRPELRHLSFAATGDGAAALYTADCVVLTECRCDRRLVVTRPEYARNLISLNSIYTNSFGVSAMTLSSAVDALAVATQGPRFYLGHGAFNVSGGILDGNVWIQPFGAGPSNVRGTTLGTVAIDTGAQIEVDDVTDCGAFSYDGPRIWGPGLVNVESGQLRIAASTAVATLLQTGGTNLHGNSTGFSATWANPSVVIGNVAITPANIDAAPGNAAGDHGLFSPFGGAIVVSSNA